MKTKKFLMTSLLVMGMIIAKAANGFPPELVLVSQPVLTYNANSVTVYYDIQNIGDYTYRGDIYIYLDPDNGYYHARKYVRIYPGRIRRVAINIPAYRLNPSWVYTVMPYYEMDEDLFSFTVFEYFEPVRFCWNGYRNEPWVVIHVGPRPRYYHRPHPYRYYYDGYYPILPPPPGGYPPGYFDGMHPLDPMHHTYAHHHHYGGYPANYHPDGNVPGYNPPAPSNNSSPGQATVVRPEGTPGSMSSNTATGTNTTNNNNAGATTRPSTNSGNSGNNGRNDSGNVSRPNTTNNSGTSSSGRTGTTTNSGRSGNSGRNDSGNVSRPSSNTSSSGTSNSGRSGNSSSGRSNNSSSSRSSSSSDRSSSNSSRSGSTGGRR